MLLKIMCISVLILNSILDMRLSQVSISAVIFVIAVKEMIFLKQEEYESAVFLFAVMLYFLTISFLSGKDKMKEISCGDMPQLFMVFLIFGPYIFFSMLFIGILMIVIFITVKNIVKYRIWKKRTLKKKISEKRTSGEERAERETKSETISEKGIEKRNTEEKGILKRNISWKNSSERDRICTEIPMTPFILVGLITTNFVIFLK